MTPTCTKCGTDLVEVIGLSDTHLQCRECGAWNPREWYSLSEDARYTALYGPRWREKLRDLCRTLSEGGA